MGVLRLGPSNDARQYARRAKGTMRAERVGRVKQGGHDQQKKHREGLTRPNGLCVRSNPSRSNTPIRPPQHSATEVNRTKRQASHSATQKSARTRQRSPSIAASRSVEKRSFASHSRAPNSTTPSLPTTNKASRLDMSSPQLSAELLSQRDATRTMDVRQLRPSRDVHPGYRGANQARHSLLWVGGVPDAARGGAAGRRCVRAGLAGRREGTRAV